jgi:hypothetical protein
MLKGSRGLLCEKNTASLDFTGFIRMASQVYFEKGDEFMLGLFFTR